MGEGGDGTSVKEPAIGVNNASENLPPTYIHMYIYINIYIYRYIYCHQQFYFEKE